MCVITMTYVMDGEKYTKKWTNGKESTTENIDDLIKSIYIWEQDNPSYKRANFKIDSKW